MLNQVASVEWKLAARHGPFEFFGLIRREGAQKWDLVVSAPWLPGQSTEAIRTVVDALKDEVGGGGMMAFSRVIILPTDSEFLSDLREAYRITDGRHQVGPGQYGRVDVAEGVLFKAEPIEATRPVSHYNMGRFGRVA